MKKNPKYEMVGSKVKTGRTMKDVNLVSDQLINKRKGENFGRIKPTTLSKYISDAANNQTESIYGLIAPEDKENHQFSDTASVTSQASCLSVADSTSSAITCSTEMMGITENTKFILLDLREEEEYNQYHIKESLNFPAPNINRDKTFSQLLRFKN